jgi:hypothetical protein
MLDLRMTIRKSQTACALDNGARSTLEKRLKGDFWLKSKAKSYDKSYGL